jgi:hypothetical protein
MPHPRVGHLLVHTLRNMVRLPSSLSHPADEAPIILTQYTNIFFSPEIAGNSQMIFTS